jgi:Ala-tRNA(Pro) deacylase
VATEDLTRVLDEAGVNYELLPHAHTESATDEAKALGVTPEDVAKTLVVSGPDGYLRAVLPGSERLDLHKLAEACGVSRKQVELASEADLSRDYPEFALGAVPPVGGRADRVIVDRRVAARESVVIEAGTHEESVRLAAADLVRVSGGALNDITLDD